MIVNVTRIAHAKETIEEENQQEDNKSMGMAVTLLTPRKRQKGKARRMYIGRPKSSADTNASASRRRRLSASNIYERDQTNTKHNISCNSSIELQI